MILWSQLSFFRVFRLPRKEKNTALLLTLYFFMAMASVSLVKSLQTALYLGTVGFDLRLPTLYLGIALLSGPLVFLYRYLARRYALILIIEGTILFLLLGVTAFSLLLGRPEEWVYLVFYVFGALFSVLLPSQGWILSYHLYTPRIAKRVFALLATGGVLGGVAGGYYTALVAIQMSSRGLLFHVVVMLLVLQGLLLAAFWISRKRPLSFLTRPPDDHSGPGPSHPVRTLLRSRHLTYLAMLILVTGLSSTLIDLQYKWVLDQQYPRSAAEITRFFGWLLGTTYLISVIVQLFGTNRILRRFGLGMGLLLLPAGLVAGSIGIIITAAFWSVVLAKAIEGSLRCSVEQTSVELLYVPISDRQNIPLKSFMELVVYRIGDGIGAALFLGIASWQGLPLRTIGAILILVAAGWLFLTRKLSEEYTQMLRRSLEYRGSRAVGRALEIDEAKAETALVSALSSANPDKLHFALQQLRMHTCDSEVAEFISGNLSDEVLSTEFSALYRQRSSPPRWLLSVEDLIDHRDHRVAALALYLMIHNKVTGYEKRLIEAVRSDSLPHQKYLTYLEHYAADPGELLDSSKVIAWCESSTPEKAITVAPLLGVTRNPVYLPILRGWIDSPNRDLRRAAIRALGAHQNPVDVDSLVEFLSFDWSRTVARRSLAHYRDAIVPRLHSILHDPRVDLRIKREIPYILTRIDTSTSRGVMVAALYAHDDIVSYRALRGLNQIRNLKDLSYSQDSFLPLLQIWAKEYYSLLNVKFLVHTKQGQASRLLKKVLDERIRFSIEKIFRGLDLFLPRGDAYFSYLGFTSSQQELRENAIELIDSRVKGELRQTLLPIFSEIRLQDVVSKGREIFKLPDDPRAALSESFFHGDPWLKCCTIGAVFEEKIVSLKPLVRQASEDISPLVQETARWALAQWGEEATSVSS